MDISANHAERVDVLCLLLLFYNERTDPVPIETDPVLEIGTIHAAAKRSYLPAWFVLFLISILNGAMFISSLLGDFIGLLASALRLFSGLAWFILFILCIMELGGYFIWRRKAVKAAERGELLETHSHSKIQKTACCYIRRR